MFKLGFAVAVSLFVSASAYAESTEAAQAPTAPAPEKPKPEAAPPAPAPAAATPATPAAPAEPAVSPTGTELDLFAMDAALDAQTTVATEKARSVREAPAVVTLITRDEIVESGARDLVDVLYQVPGFGFGVDVEGAAGVGFRGVWGHEGKVLLIVDGHEMNELLYSTLTFGNHYPLHDVQQIEIIRGPGSARYGGFAELAVIRITTRSAKEQSGASVNAVYGQGQNGLMRRNLALSAGAEVAAVPGLGLTFSGTIGQGNRSDGVFTDSAGGTADLANASALNPMWLNAGVSYKDFKARVLVDNYRLDSRDGLGEALETPEVQRFFGLYADARYDLKLGESVTVTPRLAYKRSTPWQIADTLSPLYYDKTAERYQARLSGTWQAVDWLSLTAGTDAYLDHASVTGPITGLQTDFAGEREVQYRNLALFGEALLESSIVDAILGARYEQHSAVGGSFVPRLGLTRRFGDFHAKALFSRAFRAPGIENLNLGLDARPERTTVFEVEVGYKLNDNLFVALNGFDLTITDPLVYFVGDDGTEGYRNFSQTGSRGLELVGRARYGWGWVHLGYALYTANGKNEVDDYATDDPALLLGFPAHKLTASARFKVYKGLGIGPSLVALSQRAAYLEADADGNPVLASLPAAALLNVFASYEDLGFKGVSVGLGVYNLLGADFKLPQPYAGGHAPLPALNREVMLRLGYDYAL